VALHQLTRLGREPEVLWLHAGRVRVPERLHVLTRRKAPWAGCVLRESGSECADGGRLNCSDRLRSADERLLREVVRQTLNEVLQLMKLLRQDVKQLLEIVDLLLHALQLNELLRHDVQQLLQLLRHNLQQVLKRLLLLQRLAKLLQLRAKRLRCKPEPAVRRRGGECLTDVARGRSDPVPKSRHSDSSDCLF
jgi:hypothetical protein